MADVGIRITAKDETKTVFGDVGRGLERMQSTATGLASSLASIGAGLSVGALVAFVKSTNDAVDALNDIKDATGASIENISALEDVAARTGTSMDTVTNALVKFNGALKDAKPGSGAEQAIRALGLSVADLKNLDPAEALLETAKALNTFEDDANKARLVQELFGKSLKDVAPLLKDLADQGKLVATVTTQQAEEAEKFNKELFNLQKNVSDASRSLVGPLVSSLNEVIAKFKEARAAGDSMLGAAWDRYWDNVRSVYGMEPSNKGGASGSWGDPMPAAPKPKIGPLGDPAAEKAAAEAIKRAQQEGTRELAEQARLLAELSGYSASFEKDMARLDAMYKSGKIGIEELDRAQVALWEKQPAIKAIVDETAKAWEDQSKAAAKAMADVTRDYDNYVKALQSSADSVAQQVQRLQDEEAAALLAAGGNMSLAQAIELVTVARLQEKQAAALTAGDQEAADAIKAEIEARTTLAELIRGKDVRESMDKAAADAAKQANEEWRRASQDIEKSITDALLRGFESGKGFAENLRATVVNMFQSLVLRPLVSAAVSPLAQGLAGGGQAGGGQAGGGFGGVSSIFSNINGGLTSYLAGGLASVGNLFGSNAVSSFAAGMANKSVMGPAIAAYTEAAAAATAAGNSAAAASYATTAKGLSAGSSTAGSLGWIGWVLAGMQASGDMYDAGSRWDNKYTALDPGQTIKGDLLSALGVDGRTSAVLTGSSLQQAIFNKMFGEGAKEINASGITGTFSGDMFSGQSYQEWSRSGSWFKSGSSGTDYAALDSSYSASLGKIYGSVTRSTAALAESLGLPTGQILGYVKSIRADSSQLTADGLKSLFGNIADELAATVVTNPFIKEGERASEALSRLSTSLGTVNAAFDQLDKAAVSASLVGGDAASKLLELMGGVEAFNATTLGYYQTYYTEQERNAKTAEQLAQIFADLGIAMPDTLEEFRALVDAQDITAASGREAYAALMGVNEAFATVANSAAKAAQELIKTMNFATYADYAVAMAAAGGTPVPRFANGGNFAGGVRLVGENSAEVELTGPSRILNNSQIGAAILDASGSTDAQLQALRQEQRAQAASITALTSRFVKLLEGWDVDGMPEVRTA